MKMKLKETLINKGFWGKVLGLGAAFLSGSLATPEVLREFIFILFN